MQGEWNKNTFETLFQKNEEAISRAIILLFNRQTQDEQTKATTSHTNARGFTSVDALFLTSVAKQIRYGRRLSYGQLQVLRRKNKAGFSMLTKYHRQFIEEIEAKEARKAA